MKPFHGLDVLAKGWLGKGYFSNFQCPNCLSFVCQLSPWTRPLRCYGQSRSFPAILQNRCFKIWEIQLKDEKTNASSSNHQ